ncbi:MAG: PAS domain-containing protein, partial [Desulfuromonadaceae bacterium]
MQPTSNIKRILPAIVVGNIVVFMLLAFYLKQSKEHFREIAGITTSNLTRVLADNLSGDFHLIDVVLQSTIDGIVGENQHRPLKEPEIDACLLQNLSRVADVDYFRTAEANGDVKHGIEPGTVLNIADRPFFLEAKNNPFAGLIISKPLLSRTTGKWSIFIARRMNNPDGSFRGIVYVGYFLDTLQQKLKTVDVGRTGVVMLRNSAMELLTRYPNVTGAVATPGMKNVPTEFKNMIESGNETGSARHVSPADGKNRVSSFCKVTPYPFFVFAGFSEDDFLAPWHKEVLIILVGIITIMLMSGIFVWFLVTDEKKQAVARKMLETSEARLAGIIEGTNIGTWEWNIQTGAIVINERWAQIIGYTLDELSPISIETWRAHAHPDDIKALEELLILHFQDSSKPLHAEIRMKHKGGDWVWVLDRGSVTSRSEDGTALFMHGTFLDITERKLAENALYENRNLLHTIINAIPDAVFEKDLEGRYVLFNAAAE